MATSCAWSKIFSVLWLKPASSLSMRPRISGDRSRPPGKHWSLEPVNGLYLEQLLQTNPEKLAKNTPGGPEIVGAVYVHPTAQIDPQAKVRPPAFIFSVSIFTLLECRLLTVS